MKKTLFIDMDGVLVDFYGHAQQTLDSHPFYKQNYSFSPDHIQGIFRNAPPIKGAIEAVHKLEESGKYDMFIATAAPWRNPMSAMDKRFWIEEHFGTLFHRKMFITHRKDLLKGDILIDDRTKNGAGEFEGQFFYFGWDYIERKYNPYPTWDSVLKELL
jgi:5'-nucleotidase